MLLGLFDLVYVVFFAGWTQWRVGSFPEGQVSISRGSAVKYLMTSGRSSGLPDIVVGVNGWRRISYYKPKQFLAEVRVCSPTVYA